MRFMMMVMPKGYESAAPDAVPSAEAVGKMMEYNKSLQRAGVLLALDGLLPPSDRGADFVRGRQSHGYGWAVCRGERSRSEGYWIIQVRSREEAIEWARRAPMANQRDH